MKHAASGINLKTEWNEVNGNERNEWSGLYNCVIPFYFISFYCHLLLSLSKTFYKINLIALANVISEWNENMEWNGEMQAACKQWINLASGAAGKHSINLICKLN